jgi:hypothetical protein
MQKSRPLGVTIIAILTIIGGIFLILGGVSLIAAGSIVSLPAPTTANSSPHAIPQIFGVILTVVGSFLLVIGIGYLVMFYGLLKGKGWAWTITIILLIIGVAIQIISTTTGSVFNTSLISSNSGTANTNSVISGMIGGIIGIAINLVVLYYLFRPRVRAFFGKATSPSSSSSGDYTTKAG